MHEEADTVKPLYKGQVGDVSFVPYTVTVEPLGDGSFVPNTVELLYKGQVGDRSFVPNTVKPLYKGQVGDRSFVPNTVKPLYKGQVGDRSFVPCRECVLFLEVMDVHTITGNYNLSFVQRLSSFQSVHYRRFCCK